MFATVLTDIGVSQPDHVIRSADYGGPPPLIDDA
jgi:hypothetical protein